MTHPATRHFIAPTEAFYVPELARVTRAATMADEVLLELALTDGRALGHRPGQFVQVSVFGYGEAPISVCSSPSRPDRFELCIQPVGNVSRALHGLSVGDRVGIRGPYGRGHFPVTAMRGWDVLVLAGGIGMAPLRSLVDYIRDNRDRYGRLIVVQGAKTPSSILFPEDVAAWSEDPGVELYVTVDRPDAEWTGRTGVITEPLKEIAVDPGRTMAAAVGPPVMFRFIAMSLFEKGLSPENIYFSLERRFKCGIGKCGHCQLDDLYVCQNGPVFRYSELLRRPEAGETWAPEPEGSTGRPKPGGTEPQGEAP